MKNKKNVIKNPEYPEVCCQECGSKHSKKGQFEVSTWYPGKCDICGKSTLITEVRDFFYPEFPAKTKRSK